MGLHRVAITGMGVVSAIGCDRNRFWQSLCAGRHGFAEISLADTSSLQFHHGGESTGLDLDAAFDAADSAALDRFAKLWMVAAREAVQASGVEPEALTDAGIVTGTAMAGQTTQDELFRDLYRDGRRRLTPFAVPRIMSSAGASRASMELGIQGPGMTLSTACSSSSHAIGIAFWMISRGTAKVALTGGSEAPFSLGHLKAWDSMRVVSPEPCRPFSRERKGMVLAEGAGALVLEELESARSRGAHIHAELKGFGMSSDASHITKPSEAGAARALEGALNDAGFAVDSIDYINAHGTGTLLNDVTETHGLKRVFGEHARRLAVSSSKSMHGHTLGAAGALECVATVLALENGVLPPTASYLGPDPDCDLDVVPNDAREQPIHRALSNSFAFGGLNAVLALERWNGD
jgi:nodulation protein E